MIEMDETEYLHSTVEDSVLIAVLSFNSHLSAIEAIEIKDKLLYEGEPAYGFHQLPERSSAGGTETRLEPDDNRHSFNGAPKSKWSTEDHPAPLTEAIQTRR